MKRICVVAFLLGCLIPLVVGIATAQVGLSAPISSTGWSLSFDHSGLDSAGQPETLATADVALSAAAVDLNLAGAVPLKMIMVPLKSGTNLAPLNVLLSGQPAASYRLWVRAWDVAGNKSAWAGPALVTLDPIAPSLPINVKVTVTVTVTTP